MEFRFSHESRLEPRQQTGEQETGGNLTFRFRFSTLTIFAIANKLSSASVSTQSYKESETKKEAQALTFLEFRGDVMIRK